MNKEQYITSKIGAYIGELGGIVSMTLSENEGMFLCGTGAYIVGRIWNEYLNKNKLEEMIKG